MTKDEIAKNEHEPVGRFAKFSDGIWKEVTAGSAGQPLYTTPQKKEWVGLTDDERTYLAWESNNGTECVAMTEAKLKEKNSK